MNRTPPAAVRKALRAEVNFGCPIPGCGSPFLSWHHFDPPWREQEHHNKEGMIALCPQHHLAADSGLFTKAQLREYKRQPFVQDKVSALWPWRPENIIYVLGGSVLISTETALSLQGRALLATHRCKPDDGVPSIAFDIDLRDLSNRAVFQMRRNEITAWTSHLQDLSCTASAKEIEIRHMSSQHVKLRFTRYRPDEFAKHVLKPNFADASIQGYAMARIAEASDSDGLLPVVHISGQLRTRNVTISLSTHRIRTTLHSYRQQSAEIEPKLFLPGARLRIKQAGLGELFSFG
jgi:hypothetical protein